MTLEGTKVRLRPVSIDDLDAIMEWINDNEVTRTLLTGRYPMTRETEKQWIEARSGINPKEVTFTVETLAGEYLGGMSLFRIQEIERTAELGIVIGRKSAWGKGYGTEAMRLLVGYGFSQLNLHLIYLTVLADNPRAAHIYEKIGFVSEGRLRDRVYRDGVYHDLFSMSLSRAEWEQNKGAA
jgi:RimJ/RimL family protein N-acetyltransferase